MTRSAAARTGALLMLLAMLGLLASGPATARSRPAKSSVSVRTTTHAGALRARAVRVRVVSLRTQRAVLTVRGTAAGRRSRPALAKTVRLRLRAGRPRTVVIRLTAAGRGVLVGCAPVRVRAALQLGRRSVRSARTLRVDRRRCAAAPVSPSGPGGAPTPVAGAGVNAGEPLATPGDWPSWGFDLRGSRHNPHETAITQQTVGKLELKWAFAFPDTDQAASSQPTVVGDTLYVGARNGRFYALDAKTGAQRWVFDTREVVNSKEGRNLLRDGAVVKDGTVYFGDFEGYFYALDAATGKLRWATELDAHRMAIVTGSPLLYKGRIFIGVSSEEVFAASAPTYPCCQSRGSVVALDAKTGEKVWKHYTIGQPQLTGMNRFGAPTYAPNGGSVWSTPAVDPETNTIFFGTGPNYGGKPSGETDSVVAVDAETGATKWTMQGTKGDRWNAGCLASIPGANCDEPGPDFDFGSSPNVFKLGARRVIGIGQKAGIYHLLDAETGAPIWRNQISMAPGTGGAGGQNGIQWGTSYDGQRIYAATNQGVPEPVLVGFEPGTGKVLWKVTPPEDGCRTGGAAASEPGACARAFPSAVSSTPGLVFAGARDGRIRAYAAENGKLLWEYDTVRQYMGVNGVMGNGGSLSHGGATISHGMVYTNSGYLTSNAPFTGQRGNMLLAFGLPDTKGGR